MEKWEDQGIILSVRPHGESGAVVSVITESYGRYVGYVRGIHGSKMRGTLEPGNKVDVIWQARNEDGLGSFTLELSKGYAANYMDDALKLGAMQSACALCDAALPEREGHPGLFNGLEAFFDNLDSEVWEIAYILWEIALLKELGFSLDLTKCAGNGETTDLIYVSPKTGRAVSQSEGAIYKDKLLILPGFLRPERSGDMSGADILDGLKMTGYFLDHWVFAHHSRGTPEARLTLALRFEKAFAKRDGQELERKEL